MDNLVDIIGRDSGADGGGGDIQDLAREAADLPHRILGLRVEDVDLRPARPRAVLRNAVFGPLGVGYSLRNDALRREGVDGSDGARVVEGGEGVVDARSWIRFRNYLRREDMMEDVTLRLVEGLVLALGGELVRCGHRLEQAKAGPGFTMRGMAEEDRGDPQHKAGRVWSCPGT